MHVHKTLELPEGYQHFSWDYAHDTHLNNPGQLKRTLIGHKDAELRLYTQHEIFYENEILKHTRSSPNWDGGMVTYSTCKHLMRTYKPDWVGTWIAGLCPAHCESNCLLFAGRVHRQFDSNLELSHYIHKNRLNVFKAKSAMVNPRGDLYTPDCWCLLDESHEQRYKHENYKEPPNHTRSTEHYKKSPGSISQRPDGLIPKWWRDIEYNNGRRPPSFILSPCFIFSQPLLWTSYNPGRAALKLTCNDFLNSLCSSPRE